MAIGTHATVLPPTPRPKKLIGSGRFPQVALVGAGAFHIIVVHEFFDHKVDAIRDATSCADPPTFTSVPSDCDLSSFGTVTADDVITAIQRLPHEQCTTYILPK